MFLPSKRKVTNKKVASARQKLKTNFLYRFGFINPDVYSWIFLSDEYSYRSIDSYKMNAFSTLDKAIVEYVFEKYVPDKHSKILDLGCNIGTGLELMRRMGYQRLHGVDIMRDVQKQVTDNWPLLKNIANIESVDLVEYLRRIPPKSFDIVFSKVTLNLIPPTCDVVKHVARCALHGVFLAVHENDNGWPRFWDFELRKHGFVPAFSVKVRLNQTTTLRNYYERKKGANDRAE